MTNFMFLQSKWPNLAKIGEYAENYLYTDPSASLLKSRLFGEKLIDLLLTALKIEFDDYTRQDEKIKLLSEKDINKSIPILFDVVRRYGNKAAHDGFDDAKSAEESLVSIYKVAAWFYIKVTKDKSILPLKFIMPSRNVTSKKAYNFEGYKKEQEQTKELYKEDVAKLKTETLSKPSETEADKKEFKEVESTIELNESETRKLLIDLMLKEAGWDVNDSKKVYKEYPVKYYKTETGTGRADYVLFDNKEKPIAVIEAKKTSVDPVEGRYQAQNYADSIQKMHGVRPVIFYTNGYEIWIYDDGYSEPRQIWGIYTLEDLEFLKHQHKYKNNKLSSVSIDTSIAGRPYQIEGIKKVYEKFEAGGRKALIVMATGTGKTRTVIALTKGMIEASWVKRVLFLADRDELINQAKEKKNSFKTFMPTTSSVRISGSTANDREATLFFATYQSMINYYDKFSVGFFDLVICDESHRSVYQVYRDIIQYFDAYIIGLTATPVDFINRNTFNLFDCEKDDPTFNYTIEEAWNHMPPYLVEPKVFDATTDFLRRGIKWRNLSEEQKQQLEEDGIAEEVIDFEKEHIEKFITNKDTNKFILQTLMEKGIKVGDYIGKTIIFARNINHAKLLLKLFDEMYKFKGNLACIIHSDIKERTDLLDKFKEDDLPRVAISVDMLDTGVDIPEVVNLVFAKPIYSKVKFWQMIGRGTRLCANLFDLGDDKKEFAIFDHWKNFEFFEMNPKGFIPKAQKTSYQVRFEQRVKLMQVLAEKRLEKETEYIKMFVKEDIANLPQKTIEVRKKRKSLEQLKVDNVWIFINDNLVNKLMLEIAPLMQWVDTLDNVDAINFDSQIYRLMNSKTVDDTKKRDAEIQALINSISRLKTTLNYFDGKRELVKSLLRYDTWINAGFDELEKIRQDLRDLMRYKSDSVSPFIAIDIEDKDKVTKEISGAYVLYNNNMEPYEKRVKKAIEEKLNDQMVIHKIRKGLKLNKEEVESIYNILNMPDFTYSIDELSRNTSIQKDDITGILRKFVGIDEEELNKRFEKFVQMHQEKINSLQLKTLEIIKDEIAKNKGISFAALFDKPFTNFNKNGIEGIFGKQADELFGLIEPYRVNYI